MEGDEYGAVVDAAVGRLPDQRGEQLRLLTARLTEAERKAERLWSITSTVGGRQLYKEARQAEADSLTALADHRVAQLVEPLARLAADAAPVTPTMFLAPPQLPDFEPGALAVPAAAPDPADYDVPDHGGLRRALRRSEHDAELESAQRRHAADLAHHDAAERDREERLAAAQAAHRTEVERIEAAYQAELDQLDYIWRRMRAGSSPALVAYNELLLARTSVAADYPADFPRVFELAADGGLLSVEFDLPGPAVVPTEKAFRYVPGTDDISAVERGAAETKQLYADAIARTAWAVLAVLFRGNDESVVGSVSVDGFIHSIGPATGIATRPCLVSVRTSRAEFERVAGVAADPTARLREVGARLSESPVGGMPVRRISAPPAAAPVSPRLAEPQPVDPRPDLTSLDPATFNALVADLVAALGLQVRAQRPLDGGGLDVSAFDQRPLLGGRLVVRALRPPEPVDLDTVRALHEAVGRAGANKGILVTTAACSDDAHRFATDQPVELVDGPNLVRLLAEHLRLDTRIG